VDNGQEPLPTFPQPRRRRIYMEDLIPEKDKTQPNSPTRALTMVADPELALTGAAVPKGRPVFDDQMGLF
jgi:hypothetical protein